MGWVRFSRESVKRERMTKEPTLCHAARQDPVEPCPSNPARLQNKRCRSPASFFLLGSAIESFTVLAAVLVHRNGQSTGCMQYRYTPQQVAASVDLIDKLEYPQPQLSFVKLKLRSLPAAATIRTCSRTSGMTSSRPVASNASALIWPPKPPPMLFFWR